MRRSSILKTQTSEPLIVIEDDEYEEEKKEVSRQNSEDEYSQNPYLLSPFAREVRKHSLPTPQCSGITASQVRRLSERGETTGPGPKQVEFLATLSTAPQSSGGRRHSVVTISRVPPTLFGRNRRESVAAFPNPLGSRVLGSRRESIACPPSTEPIGSMHNLQLDIMDDIVQARKVRMKMWNTSSEKVCEVQPLDETGNSGNIQRYTNSGRRFSDFIGTTLTPIPSVSKRRASQIPPASAIPETSFTASKVAGIVCSNTDLISILSSRSTSATEIDQIEVDKKDSSADKSKLHYKRDQLKSSRSNSFDISILNEVDEYRDSKSAHSNWFVKRHQPITKTEEKPSVSFKEKVVIEKEPNKVMWDERSGSIVDPEALGSAIEVFLRKSSPSPSSDTPGTSNISPTKGTKGTNGGGVKGKNWFNKGDEDSSTETCDSSICSTLKDLFVK